MLECAKNSFIHTPHQIIPHAADINKYQKKYEKIGIEHIEGKFTFYYIGEINRRKNLGDILKAFHLEFEPGEEVAILIKGHIPGASDHQSEAYLNDLSSKVKEGLKLYPSDSYYHSEVFMPGYYTDEEIMRIHETGDCFVSSTFGEAWGIPIFDAMAMGKTPICTNTGGPRDFLGNGGYLVDSMQEPCFGMMDTFSEIFVGNECWDSICLNNLRKCMRRAFENKEEREEKASEGINLSYNYSYSAVGQKMKEALESETKKNSNEKILIRELISK
tara:strand:- start:406 stop:1227 length:822 start_codon:yes stop_codon:yes gene_type:complete